MSCVSMACKSWRRNALISELVVTNLDRETLSHSSQHVGATIEDFTIFCRLCHSHKDADEKVRDVLENRGDFEEHVRQIHPDIILCMDN